MTLLPNGFPELLVCQPRQVRKYAVGFLETSPLAHLIDSLVGLRRRTAVRFVGGFRIGQEHISITKEWEVYTGAFGVGLAGIMKFKKVRLKSNGRIRICKGPLGEKVHLFAVIIWIFLIIIGFRKNSPKTGTAAGN